MKEEAIPIKDVAKDIISHLKEEKISREEGIKKIWQKVVGKRFYPHTQIISFRRKRLVVNVDSSGWLYELTMRKGEITKRLSKTLKGDFKELQFRIGEVEE